MRLYATCYVHALFLLFANAARARTIVKNDFIVKTLRLFQQLVDNSLVLYSNDNVLIHTPPSKLIHTVKVHLLVVASSVIENTRCFYMREEPLRYLKLRSRPSSLYALNIN